MKYYIRKNKISINEISLAVCIITIIVIILCHQWIFNHFYFLEKSMFKARLKLMIHRSKYILKNNKDPGRFLKSKWIYQFGNNNNKKKTLFRW